MSQIKNLPEITEVENDDFLLMQSVAGLTGKVKKSELKTDFSFNDNLNTAITDSDLVFFDRNGQKYSITASNLKAYINGSSQRVENVSLLLNFDDSPIVDSSTFNHSITLEGNTSIISDSTRGNVANFDGNGDYLSVSHSSAFSFGTADFSVSFYVKTGLAKFQTLIDMRSNNTNGSFVFLGINTSGSINLYVIDGNKITTPNGSVSANTWVKIELKRTNGQTKLLINDVQSGSIWADSTNYISTIFRIAKSAFDGARPSEDLNGKIDGVQVVKYSVLT